MHGAIMCAKFRPSDVIAILRRVSPPPTPAHGVRMQVVTAAFNDDRVALLLREKMRSCSYGTHVGTEGQHVLSTTVGLAGETKMWAVAGSAHENAQSVHGVISASTGRSEQDRPLCALGPVERSTGCDNTPGHAQESRASERVPAGGTMPLFPTDSLAQLTHGRGQKSPGERGTGHGNDANDLALAGVQPSPGIVGCLLYTSDAADE